jgi:hypothetical protein
MSRFTVTLLIAPLNPPIVMGLTSPLASLSGIAVLTTFVTLVDCPNAAAVAAHAIISVKIRFISVAV